MFSIAFVVAEGESSERWYWFLQNLIQAFQGEVKDLTIISDQEKGLLEAMDVLLSHVKHRMCMRHLWKNFKDFPGDGHRVCMRNMWSIGCMSDVFAASQSHSQSQMQMQSER